MDRDTIRARSAELTGKLSRPDEFVEGLHLLLEANVDKKTFATHKRVIPEMGRSFGVSLPVLRIIAAEIAKYGKKDPHSVLSILKTLWANGSFEERQIVGKVMERLAKKCPAECLELVPAFLPTIDNWANCDNLACFGMEAIALQRTDEALSLCEEWVRDEDKWIRRFGVVTLRAFAKAPAPEKVFEILDQVMRDGDRDVKKGVAWILRDLSKLHSGRVFEFLLRWAAADPSRDTVWMIKNGMKKLTASQQQQIIKLE